MTNKIKKFLYILEHLIPDGRDEIPTFALYHPLLTLGISTHCKGQVSQRQRVRGGSGLQLNCLRWQVIYILSRSYKYPVTRHNVVECHFNDIEMTFKLLIIIYSFMDQRYVGIIYNMIICTVTRWNIHFRTECSDYSRNQISIN